MLEMKAVLDILRVRRRVAGGDWRVFVDAGVDDVGEDRAEVRLLKNRIMKGRTEVTGELTLNSCLTLEQNFACVYD